MAQGTLRPRIAAVLPMAAYAHGLRRLADRQVAGRLVLAVRDGIEPIDAVFD